MDEYGILMSSEMYLSVHSKSKDPTKKAVHVIVISNIDQYAICEQSLTQKILASKSSYDKNKISTTLHKILHIKKPIRMKISNRKLHLEFGYFK